MAIAALTVAIVPVTAAMAHSIIVREPALPTTRCAATPLQPLPYDRPSLAGVRWIVATPAASGLTGHLFYATGPGLRLYRLRAHGLAAALYPNGQRPGHDADTMKVLWIFDNPHGIQDLGPLIIQGRNLAGRGTMREVVPHATPGTDYPSILTIPAPGCWRLSLRLSGRLDSHITYGATVTMLVVR